jgi:hypothetical protein
MRKKKNISNVADEHVAYLKTRGDEAQKAEIAKILENI